MRRGRDPSRELQDFPRAQSRTRPVSAARARSNRARTIDGRLGEAQARRLSRQRACPDGGDICLVADSESSLDGRRAVGLVADRRAVAIDPPASAMGRRARAADRLREHRESPPRRFGGTTKGACRSPGAWSGSLADRARPRGRDADPDNRGRHDGDSARDVDRCRAQCHGQLSKRQPIPAVSRGWLGAGVHVRPGTRCGARVRPFASARCGSRRRRRGAEGLDPRRDGRCVEPPAAPRAHRR